jgi:hypothetical protein
MYGKMLRQQAIGDRHSRLSLKTKLEGLEGVCIPSQFARIETRPYIRRQRTEDSNSCGREAPGNWIVPGLLKSGTG